MRCSPVGSTVAGAGRPSPPPRSARATGRSTWPAAPATWRPSLRRWARWRSASTSRQRCSPSHAVADPRRGSCAETRPRCPWRAAAWMPCSAASRCATSSRSSPCSPRRRACCGPAVGSCCSRSLPRAGGLPARHTASTLRVSCRCSARSSPTARPMRTSPGPWPTCPTRARCSPCSQPPASPRLPPARDPRGAARHGAPRRMSRLALAADPAPTLVVRTLRLPPDVDPLALLRAMPAEHRFFWERAEAGEAIAGVGAALVVRGTGAQRFAAAGAATHRLPADAVLVGGFAFDAAHVAAGPWRGFAPAEWVAPRLAVVRARGRARLVAAALDAPGGSARELDDLLAQGLAALAPRDAAPPPAAAPARYRVLGLASPRRWRDAVEAARADMAAGRLEKVVLARACVVEASAPFDALGVVAT